MSHRDSVVEYSGALWLTAIVSGCIIIAGPFGMPRDRSPMDLLALMLVFAQAMVATAAYRKRELPVGALERLFAFATVLFLFTYIYASNANMDYVQRFAEGKTYLNFGPDSRTERINAIIRYGPLLLIDFALIIRIRVASSPSRHIAHRFGLPLTLAAAMMFAYAFPSSVNLSGLGPLAFICVVPLFLVLDRTKNWRDVVFYGTFFGVVETMITNFWLGTFSLVSFQVITVTYAVFFWLFMLIVARVRHVHPKGALLLIPIAWVAFDFVRSTGFLGYPWGMLGTTQHRFLALAQLAEFAGVWGVTFVVFLLNAALAVLIDRKRRSIEIAATIGVGAAALLIIGAVRMHTIDSRYEAGERVTVSLVQQNTDPRKDDYRETFEILKRLTDESLDAKPELVVWSETAFVPNIRRWSQEDPARYQYAALVQDFLDYQQTMDTWLLTGNDDYERILDEDGDEIDRLEYNAAVLFDAEGTRKDTYRKIHLVPITEYFPFKKELPWAYEALQRFDVYLWEPGNERVVFEHPAFDFATPICFEDSFPRDVRLFVRNGADVIVNISNDFWSLREAEAQQHFANALFRGIENRRPFLRASASGVTTHVSPTGRRIAELPNYVEGVLVTEVSIAPMPTTLYTRFGDWFPLACLAITAALTVRVRRRTRRSA